MVILYRIKEKFAVTLSREEMKVIKIGLENALAVNAFGLAEGKVVKEMVKEMKEV